MISYLPLLLVLNTVPLYAAFTMPKNMTYSMGKGSSFQSICGRNVLLPVNGYNHELVSKGNAGGNCFATLVVGLTSKLTCKICVVLEEPNKWNLDADVMNISFTGEAENVLLKFGQSKFTETCFEGRRLDILVVEDEGYARKWADGENPATVYDFKFALKPKCSEEPICKTSVPINSSSNNNIMPSKTMDGVNVALSSVILVILGLTIVGLYCYYKCNPQDCYQQFPLVNVVTRR